MAFRGEDDKESEVEKVPQPVDDDNETKVRLDAPDDEDGGADDEDKTPDERPREDGQPRKKDGTWAAKKAERANARQAAKSWQTEKADYDRRMRQIQEDSERSTRQLREEIDRIRQHSQGGQPQDPVAAQLADIENQLEKELQLIETDDKRGYKEYNRLRRQEQKLITMQAIAERDASRPQQPVLQDAYAARRPFIESEFPWIQDRQYSDLAKRARAYKEYLVNVEGKPDTMDTDREALSTIQARFGGEYGLRPPPAAPSQRTRSLYAPPATRGMPDRRPARREVDLGEMGRGTGLNEGALRRAVLAAEVDEN